MTVVDELPTSSHKLLADTIADLVPDDWRIIGVERDIDDPDAVTVVIKLDSVGRLPAAPQGKYSVMWTITVLTPHVDPTLSDPAVFDALLELLDALDTIPWLGWTTAQKALEAGRYAFDITVQTFTKPPESE